MTTAKSTPRPSRYNYQKIETLGLVIEAKVLVVCHARS